jgi:hypothetical protein
VELLDRALIATVGLAFAIVLYPVLPSVYGEQTSIKTYAIDERFFGEGVLQVVVADPDADDGNVIEDLTIDFDAKPNAGSAGSISITVPETSDSSGKFEFFLAHEDAVAVGPADLDAINSRGVEGDGTCALDCAPFVTFGPTGDLAVDAELFEDVVFQISAGGDGVEVKYEETEGTLELDRTSYGTNSFVYVFVNDQDANLDPTNTDQFAVDPDNQPNDDLFSLSGGTLDGAITFRETGDNTARFEGRYQLGNSISAVSESPVLTLFEKANYASSLASAENDSNDSDEVSFTVGDSDPLIDVGGQPVVTFDPVLSSAKSSYAPGESVSVTVSDADANTNANIADTIILELSSDGVAELSALETGPNTGIFESSFTLGSDGMITGTNVKVENGTMAITYTDKRPADYAQKIENGQNPEKEFSLEIDVITGSDSIVVSAPTVGTSSGAAGPHPLGTQLVLSTTAKNNFNAQGYVVIIEARDENGITVFLGLQSGTQASDGSSNIETSWTPEAAGNYQIRTFAISSLENGRVLSAVSISDAIIT